MYNVQLNLTFLFLIGNYVWTEHVLPQISFG